MKHASNRSLIIVFIFALALFTALRWDITPWVERQVQQAATQAGYQLRYDTLRITGLGVRMDKLHVQKQRDSLQLDTLHITPAWRALMSGILATNINAVWQGNPISATFSRDENVIIIDDLDAVIDASRLDALNIPAKLAGMMHVQGHLSLAQHTGMPQAGELHLTWQQAKAGLAAPEFTLGDYTLSISSADQVTQPWQWRVDGGSGVALSGSGTLTPNGQNPQAWQINGVVDVNIGNANPSLAMMMQSALGQKHAKVRISGSLGTPRTDIVR